MICFSCCGWNEVLFLSSNPQLCTLINVCPRQFVSLGLGESFRRLELGRRANLDFHINSSGSRYYVRIIWMFRSASFFFFLRIAFYRDGPQFVLFQRMCETKCSCSYTSNWYRLNRTEKSELRHMMSIVSNINFNELRSRLIYMNGRNAAAQQTANEVAYSINVHINKYQKQKYKRIQSSRLGDL